VNQKEAKKTSLILARTRDNTPTPDRKKFFASFFKKEALPS
jgi:hypothetical protein